MDVERSDTVAEFGRIERNYEKTTETRFETGGPKKKIG